MEINHLQEFILLAELGNSYAAAEKLYISQSSLVRHIQAIEEEFGMPLFDRSKKGYLLNEAGKLFLPYAERIAKENERCYRTLHKGNHHENVVRLTAECKISDLMIQFRKAYPDYVIDFHRPEKIDEDLLAEKLDVAFLLQEHIRLANMKTLKMFTEEVQVLVYRDHPFYNRKEIPLTELKEETLIGLGEDPFLDNRSFDRIFQKAGFEGSFTVTVAEGMDIVPFVREKIGLALIHGAAGEPDDIEGVRAIPVVPKMEYDIYMCYRTDIALSKAAEDFIRFTEKWQSSQKRFLQSLLH